MSTLNRSRAFQAIVTAFFAIVLSVTASAQVRQTSFVIASGGGLSVGNGIIANGTIGQPIIGPAIGSGASVSQGFWFTPRASGPTLGVEIHDNGASRLNVTAYPNPCRDNATVTILVPARSHVSVRLYDELGAERALLYERETEPGELRIALNATSMPAGHYMIRAMSGGAVRVVPLVVMK